MSYPKDGVVPFSVTEGMPLTGVYNYQPNPDGPVVTPKNGYFEITRAPKTAANQVTMFSITTSKPVAGGCIFQFNVRYSTIQPATEVKLTLAADVILRYDGTSFNYCYYTTSFQQLGKSAIVVDGQTHQINLFLSPNGLVIFEDGLFIATWVKSVSANVNPIFLWQILNAGSTLNAALSGILIIPSTFAPTLQTPWDIALTSRWSLPSDIWTVVTQPANAIPVTYTTDYLRAATGSLSTANSAVIPQVVLPLVNPVGIVTYRMRINAAGGAETKISIIGENILRITNNGTSILWTRYTSGGPFETLSTSSITIGSANFTDVTVIYSPTTISLFENGVYKYTRTYSGAQTWGPAYWSLQHLTAGTAVSADLAYVRCLPLAMNHAPTGLYTIYNFLYDNRVMDLYGSQVTGPVLSYALNVPASTNQQWTLVKPSGSSDPTAMSFASAVSAICFINPAALVAVRGNLLSGVFLD
jgi:hypothetical protein